MLFSENLLEYHYIIGNKWLLPWCVCVCILLFLWHFGIRLSLRKVLDFNRYHCSIWQQQFAEFRKPILNANINIKYKSAFGDKDSKSKSFYSVNCFSNLCVRWDHQLDYILDGIEWEAMALYKTFNDGPKRYWSRCLISMEINTRTKLLTIGQFLVSVKVSESRQLGNSGSKLAAHTMSLNGIAFQMCI